MTSRIFNAVLDTVIDNALQWGCALLNPLIAGLFARRRQQERQQRNYKNWQRAHGRHQQQGQQPLLLAPQAAASREPAADEGRRRFGYRGVGVRRPPRVEDRARFGWRAEEGREHENRPIQQDRVQRRHERRPKPKPPLNHKPFRCGPYKSPNRAPTKPATNAKSPRLLPKKLFEA